jgi:hypothetical protein
MPKSAIPTAVALLALGAMCSPARADEPSEPTGTQTGKLIREVWDAAYVNDVRAGYVHFTLREISRPDGMTFLRAAKDLSLSLRRGGDVARIQATTGTDETADGHVLGVFMRQGLGKEQSQLITGFVRGKELIVKVVGKDPNDKKLEKSVAWDGTGIGLNRELVLLKEKKAKAGDEFTYSYFEPQVTEVVKVQVSVKGTETVKGPGLKPVKLVRVESLPEKIVLGKDQELQLPLSVMWCDPESMEPLRTESVLPFGRLTLVRSTKELCETPVTEFPPDLMSVQAIRLPNRIPPPPHKSTEVVYRITLPEDSKPETSFARDERQSVANVKGKTFELRVKAVREPGTDAAAKSPGKEYTESNYFINSDNDRVKELARQAVGKETDPWKQSLLIERWVKKNMKAAVYDEAMATADHVARTLSGDCTEYAMLTAAMCRAVGVPSRTAIGLIYVDDLRAPTLAYHMWTEVYVRGRWVAIDATLGEGGIGAAHLKITDHSWYETQSFKPLLPVMRVLIGKPTAEIVTAQVGQ